MSRESVEMWRTSIEDIRAVIGAGEFDPEATISRMAEIYDPDIEWDTSEAEALDLQGIYCGVGAAQE